MPEELTPDQLAVFERDVYDIYSQWCRGIWYGERAMTEIGAAFQRLYARDLADLFPDQDEGERS